MSDIVKHDPRPAERAFEPSNMEEAYKLAKILVASRMLPRHLGTPEAVFAVMAAGRELGLTALQSTRSLYFIEGKVTLSADLMVALCKRHPDCEYFRVVEALNERCACETKRRGEEPTRMCWTMDDAKNAGLTAKDNWRKFPKAMLRARVTADLCRAVYPDALMGVYDPDELGGAPRHVEKHDPETGEVAATLVEDLAKSVAATEKKDPAPAAEEPMSDEDRMGDTALLFAEQIHTSATERDLYDLGQEIKKAKLSESFAQPLREHMTRKKKELRSAMREPGVD